MIVGATETLPIHTLSKPTVTLRLNQFLEQVTKIKGTQSGTVTLVNTFSQPQKTFHPRDTVKVTIAIRKLTTCVKNVRYVEPSGHKTRLLRPEIHRGLERKRGVPAGERPGSCPPTSREHYNYLVCLLTTYK